MYITVADLAKTFSYSVLVKLSNDEHTAAEINESVVEQAIQIASERIDAALRGRYRLPLTQVPTVINGYCLTLARYWLYARRPESKMPETVKDTYTQAIKELEQIANGKLHLGIAGFSESNTTTDSQAVQDSYGDLLADSGEYRVKSANRMNTEGY